MRVGERLLLTPGLYFAILLHPQWPPGISLASVSPSDYQAFLGSETFQFVSAVLNSFGPDEQNGNSTVLKVTKSYLNIRFIGFSLSFVFSGRTYLENWYLQKTIS